MRETKTAKGLARHMLYLAFDKLTLHRMFFVTHRAVHHTMDFANSKLGICFTREESGDRVELLL